MKHYFAVLLAVVALAACGGGGDSPSVATNTVESGNASPNGSSGGNAASGNSFLNLVRSILSTSSDDKEPVAVDANGTEQADNTEAVPVS